MSPWAILFALLGAGIMGWALHAVWGGFDEALGWLICIPAIAFLVWAIPARNATMLERRCTAAEKRLGMDTEYVQLSHWTYDCYATVDGRVMSLTDALKWNQARLDATLGTVTTTTR